MAIAFWGLGQPLGADPHTYDAKVNKYKIKTVVETSAYQRVTTIYNKQGRMIMYQREGVHMHDLFLRKKHGRYLLFQKDIYTYLNDSGTLYCISHYPNNEKNDTFFESKTYDSASNLILHEHFVKEDSSKVWSQMFYYNKSNKLDSIIYKAQNSITNYQKYYSYYGNTTKTETVYANCSEVHYTFVTDSIIKEVDTIFSLNFYRDKYNKIPSQSYVANNYFTKGNLTKKETIQSATTTDLRTYIYYKNRLLKELSYISKGSPVYKTKYRYKYYK